MTFSTTAKFRGDRLRRTAALNIDLQCLSMMDERNKSFQAPADRKQIDKYTVGTEVTPFAIRLNLSSNKVPDKSCQTTPNKSSD